MAHTFIPGLKLYPVRFSFPNATPPRHWVHVFSASDFFKQHLNADPAGDELGSAIVAARQVRDLMRLCLLMSRIYPPYSKWLGTAFEALPVARSLTPVLTDVVAARSWNAREQHLSAAYEMTAGLHNDLALTAPLETHVRRYYQRPFQVLDATRFADALTATISDPLLRKLPPVGAIDQYVDSTDLTDHNHADRRNRYIAGPAVSQ